jgi:hypothetical protein
MKHTRIQYKHKDERKKEQRMMKARNKKKGKDKCVHIVEPKNKKIIIRQQKRYLLFLLVFFIPSIISTNTTSPNLFAKGSKHGRILCVSFLFGYKQKKKCLLIYLHTHTYINI